MLSALLLDQDGAEIVDVGVGRSGDHEIAEGGKDPVGIVGGQRGSRVDTGGGRARQRIGVDDSTCIVFAAVDAVRIARQGVGAGCAAERQGQRQRVLPIWPAAAFARLCRSSSSTVFG